MKNRLVFVGLLALMFLVSGCDVLEARRLTAEAAAAKAKAAEISAAYDGKARVIEAKTADKLAAQVIYEENLEAQQAAATHDFLLRQLELERRAARRANDLALLAIIGAPVALAVAVAGAVVFLAWRKRQQARRVQVYRQVAQLQRQRRLCPRFSEQDIEAILTGAAKLSWYIVAELPATVGGERC